MNTILRSTQTKRMVGGVSAVAISFGIGYYMKTRNLFEFYSPIKQLEVCPDRYTSKEFFKKNTPEFVAWLGEKALTLENNQYHLSKLENLLYCAQNYIPEEYRESPSLEQKMMLKQCGDFKGSKPGFLFDPAYVINYHVDELHFIDKESTSEEKGRDVDCNTSAAARLQMKMYLLRRENEMAKSSIEKYNNPPPSGPF